MCSCVRHRSVTRSTSGTFSCLVSQPPALLPRHPLHLPQCLCVLGPNEPQLVFLFLRVLWFARLCVWTVPVPVLSQYTVFALLFPRSQPGCGIWSSEVPCLYSLGRSRGPLRSCRAPRRTSPCLCRGRSFVSSSQSPVRLCLSLFNLSPGVRCLSSRASFWGSRCIVRLPTLSRACHWRRVLYFPRPFLAPPTLCAPRSLGSQFQFPVLMFEPSAA